MAKKRRRNKDDSKPQKKKKMEIDCSKNEHITIEEVFARFPNLSEVIFGRLDDRSLASCREVNKTWKGFVDIQRVYWIRKILRYANPQSKFHGEWKMEDDLGQNSNSIFEMIRSICVDKTRT